MQKLALATTVTALLLSGAAAHATETKIYPGAWCTPTNPQPSGNFNSWITGTNLNDQSGNGSFYCPIVKSVGSDPKLESVDIIVTTPANGNVTCQLIMYDTILQDSIFLSVAKQATGSNQTINFTNFATGKPAPWATNFAAYHVRCTFSHPIGTVGSINRYVVKESGTQGSAQQKIYPHSMCKERVTPAPANNAFNHVDDNLEWDVEQGNPALDLSCNVFADRMSNTTATTVAELAISRPLVGDIMNPSPPVNCGLRAIGSNGAVLDSKTGSVTAGPEFEVIKLNLDLATSAAWGGYQMTCSAAGGDPRIVSYRVEEN